VKKIAVVFVVFVLAASILLPVAGSANYSTSNSGVEGNFAGTFIADGSPRPPYPPTLIVDGSPRPPYPPATFEGSQRSPSRPGLSA
jgi:hypothetical protein